MYGILLLAAVVIWQAISLYRNYRELKRPVPNQWRADIDWGDSEAVRAEVEAWFADDDE